MGKNQAVEKAEYFAESIGRMAYQALLEEVYTVPKPGLVDPYSCGAHTDMDVQTFERSAEALYPWFVRMAYQGYQLTCTPEDLFRDTESKETLSSLGKKPRLVITDSQAFAKVSADTPEDIPLTSFSILLSRYKGNLKLQVEGAQMLDKLEDGDKILVCEGCTHHRQCDDIGTVKLPRWIRQHTGNKDLHFEFTSGTEFPVDLSPYKLIIHCGGCTLNEREMQYRLKCAEDQGVPITNYGTAIAHLKGVLERSLIPVRGSLE